MGVWECGGSVDERVEVGGGRERWMMEARWMMEVWEKKRKRKWGEKKKKRAKKRKKKSYKQLMKELMKPANDVDDAVDGAREWVQIS